MRKENYRQTSFINVDAEIFSKILANQMRDAREHLGSQSPHLEMWQLVFAGARSVEEAGAVNPPPGAWPLCRSCLTRVASGASELRILVSAPPRYASRPPEETRRGLRGAAVL